MAESTLPELKVGESPWDDWSRDDLLRFAQRCYAAMRRAEGVMALVQLTDRDSPFWQPGGTGGEAFALCDAIRRQVGYDAEGGSLESENLYRAFYRNYQPLLFADAVKPDGSPYFPPRYTCDTCGVWIQPQEEQREGFQFEWWMHSNPPCTGEFRVMDERDLPVADKLRE